MNLKRNLNRGLIAIDAALHGALGRIRKVHKKKEKNEKSILIVFQQLFGDAIVFSDALNNYAKLYPAGSGYQITLIARPSVAAFLLDVIPVNGAIDIHHVDFKRFVEDYSYYRCIVKKYRDSAGVIIVPGTSLSAEIFSCACNAKRKIGLVRCFPLSSPYLMAFFYKMAYTETVVPQKTDMMLQRHRLLLNYLGLKEHKAVLPTLRKKAKVTDDQHYVVVCPGSSKMEKCWPIERFVETIDFVTERYNWKVHLCGGMDEIAFEKKILSSVMDVEMVISHIGKTTFSDWSAIVQHADLVLGNDSATMHLAAAARVPSICISGVYDKFQFFPYQVDVLEQNARLPVTLYRDMPCEWCRTIGYHAGHGNGKCEKRIAMGQCSLCVDSIKTNEVIDKIEEILKEV